MSSTERDELIARVAWLYFVGNQTQQQIAETLAVSRPTVNRLIAAAAESGLVQVRISHPVKECMELAEALHRRFDLSLCEVAPNGAEGAGMLLRRISVMGAGLMERYLGNPALKVLALGFGHTLKATVDQVSEQPASHLKLLSLAGAVALDGSFNRYDVALRLADKTGGKAFLQPVPVIAQSEEEKQRWVAHPMHSQIHQMYRAAGASFIGIGRVGEDCPLEENGFATRAEVQELVEHGAVGEMLGWALDKHGEPVDIELIRRVTSIPLADLSSRPVIALAGGASKVPAILAALRGRWISGLITDQLTAQELTQR